MFNLWFGKIYWSIKSTHKYQKHFRLWPPIIFGMSKTIKLVSHWLICGCSFCEAEREGKTQVISLGFDGVWFSSRFFSFHFRCTKAHKPQSMINFKIANELVIICEMEKQTTHRTQCVYLLYVTFKLLIIVAYTISINILSGLIYWKREREKADFIMD